MRMPHILMIAITAALLAGCNPSDRRPGTWLTGEATAYPDDWSFTDAIKQIAIQVHTPYLIPHSVTIWCASLDGQLYVGASAPKTKRWPHWVDGNPDVRLGIAGKLYDVRLVPVDDEATTARLIAAYAEKYALPAGAQRSGKPRARYWHVEPR
jgi:hypothetical protein